MSGSADDYQDQLDAQAGAQYRAVPDDQQQDDNTEPTLPPGYTPYRVQQQQQAIPAPPPYDPSKDDGVYGGASQDDGSKHSGLRGAADQAWISALQSGQGLLGAVSFATRKLTGDPEIVGVIENAKKALQQHIDDTYDSLDENQQKALQSSLFGGKDAQGNDLPVPGRDVTWGSYIGAQAASLFPSAVMAIVPGGIVGKVATKMLGGVLSEGAAATAGTIASRATTGSLFGAQDAGEAYNQLVEKIDSAKPEELKQSPVYRHAIEQGMSDADARKTMVSAIAPSMAALHFLAGGIAGAGMGELLANGVVGAAEKSALARVGIGAVEGAATMGGQAAADDAITQHAQQQAGLQQGYNPNQTIMAGVGGALGGAVLGAGAGVFRTPGRAPEVSAVEEEHPAVPPAETQALQTELFTPQQEAQKPNTALGGPVPPGPNAEPGQGELFNQNPGLPEPKQSPTAAPESQTQQAQAPAPPPPEPPQQPSLASAGAPAAPAPTPAPVSATAPEPVSDIQAQLAAVADPANPKTTMFVAKGTPMPDTIPKGVRQATRPEGTLISTDAAKLNAFRKGKLTDEKLASLLDYPEPKSQVNPATAQAVQAKDAQGNVVTEAAVNPQTVPAAAEALAPHAPGGTVEVKPVDKAVKQRAKKAGKKTTTVVNDTAPPADASSGGVEQETAPAPIPPVGAAGAAGEGVVAARGGEASEEPPPHSIEQENALVDKLKQYAIKHRVTLLDKDARDYARMIIEADDKRAAMMDATTFIANGPRASDEIIDAPTQKQTIADQMKAKVAAKRAAEKARMAESAGRVKGEGFVAPESTEPVELPQPGRVQRTRAEAVGDMRNAAKASVRDINTTKGVPAEAVIRTAMRELDEFLGKNPGKTEEAVHNAIEQWGKSDNTKPIPGSKTKRADLAALMMKRMLGDEYKPESKLAVEARTEAQHAPQVFETETHARAGIEDEHAEQPTGEPPPADHPDAIEEAPAEAEPVGEVAAPPVSARVENAGNKVQHASELLTKVEQGLMTPQEAHAEYGMAAKEGRPRKYKDFADYLNKTADEAEAPGRKEDLMALLAKAGNKGRDKKTIIDKVNLQLARTGPEYAEKLRSYARELADPVGEAARAQDKAAMAQRMRDKIAASGRRNMVATDSSSRASSSYVKAARDPSLNEHLIYSVLRSEHIGLPVTLHDLLRQIVNRDDIKDRARPLHEMAKALLDRAPDIDVVTPTEAASRGYLTDASASDYYGPDRFLGSYNPETDTAPAHIVLGDDARNSAGYVETLLHEALHSVTADHIEDIRDDPTNRSMRALNAIMSELRNHMEADPGSLDRTTRGALTYALSDPHETHTMLMTNPEIQTWAAGRTASPELRALLARLGYAPGTAGRSVWRQFTSWVRRAVGLNPVASASEHALLDHIMRPATDILDRAHEYNRALADQPVVRNMGQPLFRVSSDTLGDKAADALRRVVDVPTLSDKGRGAAMAAMSLDAIHDRWSRLFDHERGNGLTAFRAAQESIQKIAKDFRNKYDPVVRPLMERLDGPDKEALGKLTRDATLADVKLGSSDPHANDHIKTPEGKAELASLEKRFNALSPEARKTYTALRDYYNATRHEVRNAQFQALMDRVFPELDDAGRAKLAQIARTKKSIDAFLANPDTLATTFGNRWETSRNLVRKVMQVQRLETVSGDYFPLRREGNYVLRYGDKTESTGPDAYGVEMFERRGDAQARRDQLAKSGVAGLSDVMLKEKSNLREILPSHPAVDELEDELSGRGMGDEAAASVRDILNTILLRHATRNEAARTVLRRHGVKGASEDASKILAQHYLQTGSTLGAIKGGAARSVAMSQMADAAKALEYNHTDGSGIVARQVLNEVQKRVQGGDDGAAGALSGLARKATAISFIQNVMSPSHMLTSSIETHSNALAFLGARHGFKATGTLTKALADVTPTMYKQGAGNTLKAMMKGLKDSDWNLAHVARDRLVAKGANAAHMSALFKSLDDAGLIDHSVEREMQRIARPNGYAQTGAGRAWERFQDMNAAGAHAVDVANKAAVAKAAFDLEFRKTGSVEKAVQYATDTVRKVAPNYNYGNKSRISTTAGPLGGFGAPALQFKQYGLHMYATMANLARASMHGASVAERKEARKALGGILATHALMAGSLTLIADPLRYVGGAYDLITGADKPHDYENDARGFLADTFGPELGQVLARGLPEAVGIAIYRRVGLANPLEMPDLDDFKSASWLAAAGKLMTGAPTETAANYAQGLHQMLQGDVLGGLKSVVPRPIRDVMKAATLAQDGLKDSKGHTMLTPDQIGPGGVLAQGLGFQPAIVSEAREGRAAINEQLQADKSQHSKLVQAWLGAQPADRAGIMAQIRQWNQGHHGQPITLDYLYRQLAAMQSAARAPTSTAFGLRVPKGSNAAQAGSFAYVPN
jgi:hypothetical protein